MEGIQHQAHAITRWWIPLNLAPLFEFSTRPIPAKPGTCICSLSCSSRTSIWYSRRSGLRSLGSVIKAQLSHGVTPPAFTAEQEVCKLRWEWEVQVPELATSVFIIPSARMKNGEDRLVVLNQVARSVIDEAHSELVFTYRGRSVLKINNSAWKCARDRAADQLEADIGPAVTLGLSSCPCARSRAHVRPTAPGSGSLV